MGNNRFLDTKDYETAWLLGNAVQVDIGKAVAYTDGNTIYVNTDENLKKLLPAYDEMDFMKWLLWHEELHKRLSHHHRFKEYREKKWLDEKAFGLNMSEVNIIMDILVHDTESRMFPSLIPLAKTNLAQMRDHNSLSFTFKTATLEEMLEEYRQYKQSQNPQPPQEQGNNSEQDDNEGEQDDSKRNDSTSNSTSSSKDNSKTEQMTKTTTAPTPTTPTSEADETKQNEQLAKSSHHDDTDWSQLKKIDREEFIDEWEGEKLKRQAKRVQLQKLRVANLTTTMRQLATASKERTYLTHSYLSNHNTLFKGRRPIKASLYLCFDCSGSMKDELALLKEIVAKSVPQAYECPAEWHSGEGEPHDIELTADNTYQSKFKDMQNVCAAYGTSKDGDLVMLMCAKAEQKGYNPVAITDGGGFSVWIDSERSEALSTREGIQALRKLKNTIIITQYKPFMKQVKRENPHIQVIYVGE